ncbi:MAG: OsmC family protein [Candidatus Helarchaeota archaeon]
MGFKETYEAIKKDPKNGEKNFNVIVELQEDGSFKATMGAKPHEIIIDAPPGLDGKDLGPSPLLLILAATGGCIAAVIGFWAKIMDVKIDHIKVFSRGHINLGGIFATDDSLKPYYDNLNPVIQIKSSEPQEKIDKLMKEVWDHCPIINNLNKDSGLKWKYTVKP